MLGAIAVSQQPPQEQPPEKPNDGSTPLTQVEIDALTGAFDLIVAIGQEEGRPQDEKKEYETIVKNLRDALGDKPCRIRTGGTKPGQRGVTRGEGDDPKKKELRFDKDLLKKGADKTKKGFIALLDVVFHEGVHIGQNAKKSTASNKPSEVLEWKIGEVKAELEAWKKEWRFKGRIVVALDRMHDNLTAVPPRPVDDGVPGWAVAAWGGCNPAQLSALLSSAEAEQSASETVKNALQAFLDTIHLNNQPGDDDDGEIAVWINEQYLWKEFCGEDKKRIQIYSESSKLEGAGPFESEYRLETGIPHPQDVALIADWRGRNWLLVCGVDSHKDPRGIVRAFPEMKKDLPPKDALLSRLLGEGRWCFDETQGKTIVSSDMRLGRATSLVAAPDGRVWVWDVDAAGLYPILDVDGDCVPDFVEFRFGSMVKSPKGLNLDDFADVAWIGGQPVAQRRIGGSNPSAGPMLFFRDVDGDGYFESVLPLKGIRVPEKEK